MKKPIITNAILVAACPCCCHLCNKFRIAQDTLYSGEYIWPHDGGHRAEYL
jgi:hypothetical protein